MTMTFNTVPGMMFPQRSMVTNCPTQNAPGKGEPAVDVLALAKLLGVEADPKTNPLGFADELRAKAAQAMGALGGQPGTQPDEEDIMDMTRTPEPEEDDPEDNAVAVARKRTNNAERLASNERANERAMNDRMQELWGGID